MSAHEPHTAVIDCRVEVSKVNPSGEISEQILNPKILEENDIKPSFLLSVSGYNVDDCLSKLKKKIQEFNNE